MEWLFLALVIGALVVWWVVEEIRHLRRRVNQLEIDLQHVWRRTSRSSEEPARSPGPAPSEQQPPITTRRRTSGEVRKPSPTPPPQKPATASTPSKLSATSEPQPGTSATSGDSSRVTGSQGRLLRRLLEGLHLWPPSSAESGEAHIAAWWTTRLGTLLAVIAAVFFGVYLTQGTPPWVKFVELLGAALAVTAIGFWQEKRLPQFGAVVFGGGLALTFFAVFAGYALPPVQIFHDPLVGGAAQFAVVVIIAFIGQSRQSLTIVSMALLMGYVSCAFSLGKQLDHFGLIGSLILAIGGSWFYVNLQWALPFLISVAASYTLFAILLVFKLLGGAPPWVDNSPSSCPLKGCVNPGTAVSSQPTLKPGRSECTSTPHPNLLPFEGERES